MKKLIARPSAPVVVTPAALTQVRGGEETQTKPPLMLDIKWHAEAIKPSKSS